MSESYAQRGQSPPQSFGRGANDGRSTDEGIGSLLSGLLTDLQDLIRGEVKLARAEVKEDLTTAGRGIGMLGAAALVGVTGFIFLMLGLTYLLNKWMQMWIAAAIVGGVLAVIAIALAMSGRRQLSATELKPDRTIDSLKEDQAWAKQQISSVKR
jgi:hypothetical protein